VSILFLDVDGVLNNRRTRQVTECGCTGVDGVNVKHLQRILKETGCAIVVSSTWRRWPELMRELWAKLGAETEARCLGFTPVMDSCDRGIEIQKWLNDNEYRDQFVIVDDDSDMVHLAPYLVKTDNNHGLTGENADEIIRRLNA
jgi:hypothetical protein